MSEIQQVALSILKKVVSICEKRKYRYSLAFGTLIGAIRHKGFIPWDDDIDIIMPRPDYEELLDYLHTNPIDDLDVFYWKYKKDYYYGITRICDMRYKIVEEGRIDCGMGIFIDIYPLDGLSNNKDDSIKLLQRADSFRDEVSKFIYTKDQALFTSYNPFYEVKRNVQRIIRRLRGLQYYQKKYEQNAKQHSFNDFEYVGIPNWHCNTHTYKRKWFNEFLRIKFEDSEFNVVKKYDEMLREDYGDYMQLPPVEKRIYQHCYTAYKIK